MPNIRQNELGALGRDATQLVKLLIYIIGTPELSLTLFGIDGFQEPSNNNFARFVVTKFPEFEEAAKIVPVGLGCLFRLATFITLDARLPNSPALKTPNILGYSLIARLCLKEFLTGALLTFWRCNIRRFSVFTLCLLRMLLS